MSPDIKSIYISGPMSNKPNNGHDDFERATRWLRHTMGYEVVSPHEMDRQAGINEDGTLKPEVYASRLAGDIHTILWVDAVVVLLGWEDSPGAQAEVAFARAIGLPILEYSSLNPLPEWKGYRLKEIMGDVSETGKASDDVGLGAVKSICAAFSGYDVPIERVVSSTGGEKDSKAQRFDLIPWEAVARIAEVYSHGCQKYAPRNWEKGYSWGLSFASLQRHLTAFWDREDLDPESGLPHLAHAGFHLLALLHFSEERGYGEHDDRS